VSDITIQPPASTEITVNEVVTTVNVSPPAAVELTVQPPASTEITIQPPAAIEVTVTTVGIQGPPGTDATFNATNKSGSTIYNGMPVAVHSSGIGVVKADATNDQNPAIGIAITTGANNAAIDIQTGGTVEVSDWTAITGTTTLAAKGRYYLDTTAGTLTTTPPASASNILQLVGVAVSDTTLEISIWDHITL